MLHVPQASSAQRSFGCNYKNNLVTVRRQAWSYFTYGAQEEVKQAHLKQAALCQVYEDFTGIYFVAVVLGFAQVSQTDLLVKILPQVIQISRISYLFKSTNSRSLR